MIDGDKKLRVVNKCNYDIGVTLTSGQKPNIRANSFLPLSVNDILYIESIARGRKPFSSKQLIITTDDNRELTLEDLGGYTDTYAESHFSNEEIRANLEKPNKAVAKWLEGIEDPVELHAIRVVADEMDLPTSKMRILQAKIPNIDLLQEE